MNIDICKTVIYFRKLVSYAYFSRNFPKDRIISSMDDVIRFMEHYLANPDKNSKYFAFAIGYYLSSISLKLRDLSYVLDFSQFYKIIEISIKVFLNPKFLYEEFIPLYFDYFTDSFILFSTKDTYKPEYDIILTDLIKVITSIFAMPFDLHVDSIGFTFHILVLLSPETQFVELPRNIRNQLFLLITSACTKYKEVSEFLMTPENLPLLVAYISDSISAIKFINSTHKDTKYDIPYTNLPEINSHIENTFDNEIIPNNYESLSKENNSFPSPPSEITKNSEAILIFQAISRFVTSIKTQRPEKTHIELISVLLQFQSIYNCTVTPYFFAHWLTFFLKNDLSSNIEELYKCHFFEKIFDMVFNKFPNDDITDYYCKLLVCITVRCDNECSVHFFDMIHFYFESIKNFRINQKFVETFYKCILTSPQTFSIAALEANFCKDLSLFLTSLQSLHYKLKYNIDLSKFDENLENNNDNVNTIDFIKTIKEAEEDINETNSNSEHNQNNQNIEENNDINAEDKNDQKVTDKKEISENQMSESERKEKVKAVSDMREHLFRLIDIVDSFEMGISLLWNNQIFSLSICKLIFDDTTKNFTNFHLKIGLLSEYISFNSIKVIFEFYEHLMLDNKIKPHLVKALLENIVAILESNKKCFEEIVEETNILNSSLEYILLQKDSQLMDLLLQSLVYLPSTIVPPIFYFKALSIIQSDLQKCKLFKLIFKDDDEMKKPRLIQNSTPYPSLFLIMSRNDNDLKDFIDFTFDCINDNVQSLYNLSNSDMRSTIIKFMKKYRKERKSDELFFKVLSLFERLSLISITSGELTEFIQLLPSISKDHRPFYTKDILKTFKSIISNDEENPTCFFHGKDKNSYLKITDTVPKTILNGSFFIYMYLRVTSVNNGYLFSFFNSQGDIISLNYSQGKLIFMESSISTMKTPVSYTTALIDSPKESLFNNKWTPFVIAVDRSGKDTIISLMTKNNSYQSVMKKIVHNSDFTELLFCNDMISDVSNIFISRGLISQQNLNLLLDLPPSVPVAFSKSEINMVDDKFSPLFSDDFSQNIICILNAHILDKKGNAISMKSNPFAPQIPGSHRDSYIKAIVNSTINHNLPGSLTALSMIGGATVLLPVFSQIHQELNDTNEISENNDFLMTILNVLHYVLMSNYSIQESFCSDNGFKILSFLLSMIHPSQFNLKVVNELFSIFGDISHKKLMKQMFKYIFMNMNLWCYVTPEIQKILFERIFDLFCQNSFLRKSFSVRKILSYVHIFMWESMTEVSLLVEPKTMVKKFIPTKRPELMKPLRDLFYNGIYKISLLRDSLDPEDVSCLFSFCFDTRDIVLQEEILELTVKILSNNNQMMVNYIKTHENILYDLFSLLKLGNSQIFANVAIIYSKIGELDIFDTTFHVRHWIIAMISEFPVILSPFRCFELLLHAVDVEMSKLNCSEVFPILIYVALNNNESSLQCIIDILNVLNDRSNWLIQNFDQIRGPLVSLLISELPNDFDSSLIADKVFEFFIPICCANVQFLNEIYNEIVLYSSNSNECYLHIYRRLLIGVLSSKKLRLAWGGVDSIKTTMDFFSNCFYFIFFIPSFDPYYYMPNTKSFSSKKNQKTAYQFVFDVLANNSHQNVTLKFATRTNCDLSWEDLEVAQFLLLTMLSMTPSLSFDRSYFASAEMVGYLFATILQHGKSATKLINGTFDRLVTAMPHQIDKGTAYHHLLVLVCGSILREFLAGTESGDQKKLFVIFSSFKKQIEKLTGVSVPNIQTVDGFIPAFKSNSYLINRVTKEFVYLDDNFAKRLPLVESELIRNLDMFQNVALMYKCAVDNIIDVVKDKNLEDISESSRIIENRINIEKIRQSFELSQMRSMKYYRQLFATLSDEGQPWCSNERVIEYHYKLSNTTYGLSKHSRMKRNLDFDIHAEASDARDSGSLLEAKERYKEIIKDKKLTEFTGDAALVAIALIEDTKIEDKNENLEEEESVKLQIDATIITPKQTFIGKLILLKDYIRFQSETKNVSIRMESITEILFRRYLHLDTAIEIFTNKHKSYFFDFAEGKRQIFIKNIKVYTKGRNKSLFNLKFLQENNEDAIKKAQKVYRKWQMGEISNFQMLMKINRYSGRSFNDLSQYPVFPWILADYKSEKLNLEVQQTFRNLSWPIGRYNEERLQQLQERLNEHNKHLFGSFYSSAASTLGYLIRLEPFTSLHIELQSGRFDNANRLFNSVPHAWDSVTSLALDFRELIPEFFYLPEMFLNLDNFDLGVLAEGTKVNDVELPPWSDDESFKDMTEQERRKARAMKFVNLHMQALESRYVSANLHQWIDLIFGPKSRGEEAKKANNTYHDYYFDESLTDEIKNDPIEFKMIKEYAACFGTAPMQLFLETPKPKEALFNPLSSNMFKFVDRKKLSNKKIIGIKSTKTHIAYASKDGNISVFDVYDQSKSMTFKFNIRNKLKFGGFCGNLLCTSTKNDTAIICYDFTSSLDPLFTSRLHFDEITCLSCSGEYFATGSKDMTVRIWKTIYSKKTPVLYGSFTLHTSEIAVIDCNVKADLCVSVGTDGKIIALQLSNSQFTRSSKIEAIARPSFISVVDNGFIVILTNVAGQCLFNVFDENLGEVTTKKAPLTVVCLCQTILPNGQAVLMCGTSNNRISIFSLPFVKELCYFETGNLVTAISFDKVLMHILAGTREGDLVTYKISNFRNIP